MEAAWINPHTSVDVVNISSGDRIQTHVIEGPKGSGTICLDGAAAHLFEKGDLAIVMGYEQVSVSELSRRISRAVLVDGDNQIDEIRNYRTAGLHELGLPENNRLGEIYPPRSRTSA